MGYRLDIQLLRAFAVIIVVLYHLNVPFFGKGFLGVDVFFVISGFLMAVLYKQGQPAEFLMRRARRLLPPYVAVLLATMLAGLFILLPNELSQLKEQSIYSALFAANIGFWNENSYFSSAGFKPLLHLWSLGVEVQYYLFVPIIMWLFHKHRSSLILLGVGSFALCSLMLSVSPKTAFFMMPLRGWEFLLGAMAGLYFTKNGGIISESRRWVGAVGALCLIASLALPVDGEKLGFLFGHPGLAALLICLSTFLVLTFGIPVKILDSNVIRPFIYIGKISYSIYLVHFPAIIFYFYEPFSGTTLTGGDTADTLILLTLIAGLSISCYYLIEKRGPKLNQWKIACSASIIMTLLIITNNTVISKRFSSFELGFLTANQDRAPYRCGKIARILDPTARTCLLQSLSDHKKSVLLVGNSHADSIKIAFNETANLFGFNTYFIVSNTPLMAGGISAHEVVNEAISKNIDVIITHHSPGAVSRESYLSLQQAAAENGITLVVIAPIPVYEEHIPSAIYRAHQMGHRTITLQSKEEHMLNVDETLQILRDVSEGNPKTFTYYDPSRYLCGERCVLMGEDGRAWYFDTDHLTLTGATQLRPLFKDIFTRLELEKKAASL